MSSSAFFVFTGVVSRDLDVVFEQQSWIIVSDQVSFPLLDFTSNRMTDILHGDIRFVPIILGSCFRSVLGETSVSDTPLRCDEIPDQVADSAMALSFLVF